MGLRSTARRHRVGLALAGFSAAALLAGCSPETSAQWGRLGMPEGASDRSPVVGQLWNGSWIAAMVVGVFVWGLIGYAGIRYRRKRRAAAAHDDETPRQTRYNLPMEILYTITPLLIVGVLFVFTVQAQTEVLARSSDTGGRPDRVVDVVGQKWSWTFNYRESLAAAEPGTDVYAASGTINDSPDLYLPVNQSVQFNLSSPDVIHSFWVPEFYFKMDLIPGRDNSFEMTPTREGTFIGKCAELCGTYHSAMIFRVHVVSEAEYDAYLQTLADQGNIGTNYGSQTVVEPKLAPQGGEGAADEETQEGEGE